MVPFIPFVSSCTPTFAYCLEVAERFFDTRNAGQTLAGHQHVIFATSDSIDQAHWIQSGIVGTTCKGSDSGCGLNNGSPGTVFVFDRAIEQWSGLSPVSVAIGEVSAHELAHVFDVNQPITSTNGHCTNQKPQPGGPMASNQAAHCLMNGNRTNAERVDGVIGFHNDPWDTSEYRRIRARPDPIPQIWQSAFSPNP